MRQALDRFNRTESDSPDRYPPMLYWGLALIFSALTLALLLGSTQPTIDWTLVFYPASQAWLAPYTGDFHFVYPPWMAALLAPFALFPIYASKAVFSTVCAGLSAWAIRRLGGNPYHLILFFLSPPVFYVLANGQVDLIPLFGLGLVMSSSIGLASAGVILIAAKPQLLGLAIPLIWWFSPKKWWMALIVSLFGIMTLIIWPIWPLEAYQQVGDLYTGHSIALFPAMIPLGLYLLYRAWTEEDIVLASLATFCFVPYFNSYSLAAILPILYIRSPFWVSAILLVAQWIFFIGMGCIVSVSVCLG